MNKIIFTIIIALILIYIFWPIALIFSGLIGLFFYLYIKYGNIKYDTELWENGDSQDD